MEDTNSPTPITRVSGRRQGQYMSKEERSEAQTIFLEAFRMHANVRLSAMKANIDRTTFYYWLNHDEEFAEEYQQAELDANDVIRAAIYQRAVKGVEEPVVSMGRVVYDTDNQPVMVRRYSDTLLQFLAKARMPEFREKQHLDVYANMEGSITTEHTMTIDTRALSPEHLASLKAIALDMKMSRES